MENETDYFSQEVEPNIDYFSEEVAHKIPKTEPFLQRAIKATGSGLNAASDFSKGFLDIESFGSTRLGESLGTKAANALFPDQPPIKTENPETPARAIGQAVPIVKGIGSLIKGGYNLVNVGKAERGLSDVAYTGSQKVKARIPEFFKEASDRFGQQIDNLPSMMNEEKAAEYISKSAQELGNTDIVGTSANKLQKLAEQLSASGGKLTAKETNMIHKQAIKLIGNDNQAKAILRKHFLDTIKKEVPGLTELKASHEPVYQTAKEAKSLNRGTLKRIGQGKMGPQELADLKKTESKLGNLKVTSEAEKAGKKLGRTKFLNKVSGAAGLSGVGYGIYRLIRKATS